MSSKYFGLPDIDTAQDVFETADEPESALRPNDLGIDEEEQGSKTISIDIDASELPERRRAEKVFARGTRRPDASLIFRPRLPPLTRHRSCSSSSSDEPLKETPAARLRRLKAELEEVEAEIKAGPSTSSVHETAVTESDEVGGARNGKRKSVLPPRTPVDLVSELGALRSKLTAVEMREKAESFGVSTLDWNQRLQAITKPAQDGSDHEPNDQRDVFSEPSNSVNSLSSIDKRLASLEDTIGPSNSGAIDTSAPLLTTLQKLDHLLILLTQPRHLDAISRRVKLLLVDLDRAAAASRRQPLGSQSPEKGASSVALSSAEYESLQSLFAILPRLDPLIPIITPLLARLKSLSGLHAEAAQTVSTLRAVQEGTKRNGDEVKELVGVVQGVKGGLEEGAKAVERNWTGLGDRMKSLEDRIKALGS
ncbi:hypothetical protein BD324DRAFT_636853 [Kockovaella imperatae]|uniref:Dynamitin-domain-containing protein n=1 Tax=Kockovaella imperatae TaxID=4999 RepID=A0A1Y1U804_9TREE|nr:hypothetical protein BD324DRAFT_636853 [Kockovaella imperatae]ORX34148.1 hypothetical protein BD324DRAFT_636853 [Kockovaella imperatae]